MVHYGAAEKLTGVCLLGICQVPGVLVLDVTSPDLPTARLEHKAHLTLNDFDKIMLQEVRWQHTVCDRPHGPSNSSSPAS